MKQKKKHRFRRFMLWLIAIAIVLYNVFVYANIPFIRYWRNVWIETAMTTMTHRYLAEYIIPERIVDEVMANQIGARNDVVQTYTNNGKFEKPENEEDPLEQKELKVGSLDDNKATVIVNDVDQGILITELKTSTYCAKVMQVFDPSRVFVGFTKHRGEIGMVLTDLLWEYDAIAGVNASGFYDPGGNGMGGEIVGYSIADGEEWGKYDSQYDSICFDENNRLLVGPITPSTKDKYRVRDGIQFGPVLVNEGKKNVKGTAGYGLQPRTAIGQKLDGTVIFITCDGRQPGYSIGMDLETLADLMLKYEANVAALCDGGSSTVMAYKGKILTKPSGLNKQDGRYLPDAFLIRRKK